MVPYVHSKQVKTKSILLFIPCLAFLAHGTDIPDKLWDFTETYGYVPTGVAVSPDGQFVATPGGNGVQIRRVADGSNVTSLAYGSAISTLAVSANGKFLAAAGGNPPVSVWRTDDWSLAYSLSSVLAGPLAFSPDSAFLATASNTVIQLRNATNGVFITSWTNPPIYPGAINTLAFSPDGTKLASGAGIRGSDLNLKLWSVPSGALLLNIPTAQTYSVGFVTFSPDGKLVATAGGQYNYGPAQVWRVADGSLAMTFPEWAYEVAFSPDSAVAIVAAANITIHSVATGSLITQYAGGFYQRAAATTPDGNAFVVSEYRGHNFAARLPLWMHVPGLAGSNSLSWSGGSGRFQLQQRTNLSNGAWQNIGGVLTNRTAVVPSQLPGFYRVVSLPN